MELLWPDLKGKMTDPKINQWIQDNLFSCSKEPQLVSLEQYEHEQDASKQSGICPLPDTGTGETAQQIQELRNCVGK